MKNILLISHMNLVKLFFYVRKTLFQKDFFTVKTLSSRQPYSLLTEILLTVYIVCKS